MRKAKDRGNHVVIRASAGTGKTFQLSNRFLQLLCSGEPVDGILATTFTRKAAGEILDRVLGRLAEAALDSQQLAELTAHLDDSSLNQQRCLQLIQLLLGKLHRLRVGTLDSFFLQIARSFALELGFPPGWQIVDELVDARLRQEAVRQLLEDQKTAEAAELMFLLTKGEVARSVDRQISELVNQLYSVYSEAPAAAWEPLVRLKPLPPHELEVALTRLAAVPLPAKGRLANARDEDLQRAARSQWDELLLKGLSGKIFCGEGSYYRQRIPEELVAAYRPLVEQAKAEIVGRIANQTAATYRLLAHFDACYQRLKQAHRAMRFEDVARRLTDSGVANQMETVAFRLDAHIGHMLLDEFQDTSPLQWRVLRPFAQRIMQQGGRRSFFCVGDVKQAIYGWRGGVAEIFETLDDDLGPIDCQVLDQSRRSAPPVIDTVNQLFGNLATNPTLEHYPEAAQRWSKRFQLHSTVHQQKPGYCQLLVAPAAGEGQKPEHVTLDHAVELIRQLHQQSPRRSLGVLVRKNEAVGRLIYGLRCQRIDASEEGGNPLTDSPAVELLLSVLTLADHPGDTVARFHVAQSPLAEYFRLTDFSDAQAAMRVAQHVRQRLMAEGYGATLYDWVCRLAPVCDHRQLSRLLQLVELAYDWQPQATLRTDDFVDLVSQKRVEDPSSGVVRVMTIHQAKGLQFDIVVLPQLDTHLTGQPPRVVVGRSRPSEPIRCVCRYVSKKLREVLPTPLQEAFRQHECQVVEEALCLLYVAMTRAVHALHMIIAPPRANERRIPATVAGLLRAGLAGNRQAEPDAILYEHGNPNWVSKAGTEPSKPPVVPRDEGPLKVRLAEPPPRALRGLQRRSPAQLEGGPEVDLAYRLQLDRQARDRGTLIHAWFEQIEWLEDGLPSDDTLQQIAKQQRLDHLDLPALIRQFHAALSRPAIRAALSRATYRQPRDGAAGCAIHASSGLADPRWMVWRECPFITRQGDALLRGAMDRLVVLYEGQRPLAADVLDFKTDTIAADDAAAIAERVTYYRPQLQAYRHAAAQLHDLDPARVSARLAFVEAGVVAVV